YFAGPEIYAARGEFPSIWNSGEKGSGKTYTGRFLMPLHGHAALEGGISLKLSTAVGLAIALSQNANIPVWGDEYKRNELLHPEIEGVIHSGYNRDLAAKWVKDGRIRAILTNLIVTGESTCENAATMSRFISVVAAREKRK